MKSTRPPVVAVLGHIDHGKSTLLDYIRKTNTAEKEVGGITQNMSAYEVVQNGKKITFLDTPGHEAFQELRGRGARVADIGILVVSAEDGVKQQTKEALKVIVEAKLPYIVAINKMDKPGADVDRTKQSLAENEIFIEGYGGSIPFVPVSALTGKGVPELLDMVNLVAELEELTANSEVDAEGVVLETNRDKQKGVSATLIIKNGTLRSGMYVVSGEAIAPVRIFEDSNGKNIKEAGVCAPVSVIGFDEIPTVGDSFTSYVNKKQAEDAVIEYRQNKKIGVKHSPKNTQSFLIPAVIKADSSGVIEAIEHQIRKVETERAGIKIVSKGIGAITESDIKFAAANLQTIVLGFNTKVDPSATDLAERLGIKIKVFSIIYKLSEWVAEIIEERTPKIEVEEERGKIKILKTFSSVKDKQVLGGRVEEGKIRINDEVAIFRREAEIGKGRVRELQQAKNKTSMVEAGSEFGAMIESKIEIVPGDYVKPIIKVVK